MYNSFYNGAPCIIIAHKIGWITNEVYGFPDTCITEEYGKISTSDTSLVDYPNQYKYAIRYHKRYKVNQLIRTDRKTNEIEVILSENPYHKILPCDKYIVLVLYPSLIGNSLIGRKRFIIHEAVEIDKYLERLLDESERV